MTTMQDVARRAGVAPITVSRVINNSGYVTLPVRTRVEAAIAEMGYVPNTLARSLRSQRTHTLALLVTDVTNPFFTTIARGVEDTASAAGYMLILCNTDERPAKEREYLQMLLQKRVDGILLVPAGNGAESLHLVQRHGTPLVVLDRRVAGEKVDIVRCDSVEGAYQLGRLLTSLGHRTIAVLAGPQDVSTSHDRIQGFQQAIADAGITDRARIYYGDFSQQGGRALTQQALSAEPRPTALFATNNFIAIGTLNTLQEAGLRVPEDIALVSFDDLPPSLVTFPFLTVASQPAYEMGCRAVALLLHRLEGHSEGLFQEIVTESELIVRRSSGDAIDEQEQSRKERE